MFNRFVGASRELVARAQETARDLGSPTIESEHLLLAFTEDPGDGVAEMLADAGLDRRGVELALEAEGERSLAAVGISAHDFDLPAPRAGQADPRFAASAKLALERCLEIAVARGHRRIEPAHVLLGVLSASRGTVPRALEQAGVDREALSRRIEAHVLAAR